MPFTVILRLPRLAVNLMLTFGNLLLPVIHRKYTILFLTVYINCVNYNHYYTVCDCYMLACILHLIVMLITLSHILITKQIINKYIFAYHLIISS